MRRRFTASLLLLFSLTASADAPAHSPFGLSELTHAVESSGASTIEELVPLLARGFDSNFTLVYKTGSPQKSDSKHPRVVLWDELSGFAAAYSGLEKVGGRTNDHYNILEMWRFDSKTKSFEFLTARFPLERGADGKPVFKPESEESCKACHGKDPRPTWAEYPSWPGSYGSKNDLIEGKEKRAYETLVNRVKADRDPRYAPLFELARGRPNEATFPYRSEAFAQSGPHLGDAAIYRPNLRLGLMIARLNTQRILDRLKRSPSYLSRTGELLRELLSCDGAGVQKNPEQLFAEFGLKVQDIDPRAEWPDAVYRSPKVEESYFDGSASMNELLAAAVFRDAIETDSSWRDFYFPRSLRGKYPPNRAVNLLDQTLYAGFDALGHWFPTPYPEAEIRLKHRESFNPFMQENWEAACAALRSRR